MKRSLRMRHLLMAPLALMLFTGCGSPADSTRDINEEAARIVSIGPVITHTLVKLGLANQLVATDLSSRELAGVDSSLANLGYYRSLNAEGILALKPTLILASSHAGPPAVLEQLQQTGVRVVVIPAAESAEGGLASIDSIAHAVGQDASQLRKAYADMLAAKLAPAEDAPRALFCYARGSADKLFVLGESTAATPLAKLIGVRNAMTVTGTVPLNAEAILGAQPDWLILPQDAAEGLASVQQLSRHPQLGKLEAVQAGRVLYIPSVVLFGFGPETPEVVSALRLRVQTVAN